MASTIPTKQLRGTVKSNQMDISGSSAGTDPASRNYVNTQITNSVYGKEFKDSVRVASTVNIATLSGLLTVDGITLVANDRVLVKNQTTASQNGIWVAASGAWSRALDAADSTGVTPQMAVSVEEGTTNGNTTWKITNTGTITVGTTNLTFSLFSTTYYATPTTSNKNMTASVTAADFDVACATAIAATPAQGSYVYVEVNGIAASVGNGVKTADCYFSGDSGTTARAYNAIVTTDKLYWVGSVAGFQLDAADRISFDFVV